jgi:hypothetical protein
MDLLYCMQIVLSSGYGNADGSGHVNNRVFVFKHSSKEHHTSHEVNKLKYNMDITLDIIPKVHCNPFEDSSGAVEMVNIPKMHPRSKHINTKYHHF